MFLTKHSKNAEAKRLLKKAQKIESEIKSIQEAAKSGKISNHEVVVKLKNAKQSTTLS